MAIIQSGLKRLLRIPAVGAAFLLAGCAAVSPESRLDEAGGAPAVWAAAPEARAGVDRKWIRKTGGSELASLVEEALRANPDLRAAASRVDRAAAEAKIAGAARLPTLDLGASGVRQQQRFVGLPIPGGAPASISNSFGVSLDAAWELDVWGRVKSGQEAAIADAQASGADFAAARVSLAGQVAKAWLALAEANEQVRLAEGGLEARGILAQAVRERFERAIEADGGSAAQVRLTESEVASGEAVLAERRQEKQRVVRQLELLLGRYPSGRLVAAARLPGIPPTPPAGVPSELLLRRPDVLAAERRLAAEGRRTREAHLAKFPSVRLTGSMGTVTDSLRNILSSDYGVWSIGGSVAQPIFQGGRLAAGEERAAAVEREVGADLQRVVLRAFGEVEQALVAEAFLREREAAVMRAAGLARDAAARATEEFDAGTGDVLTLIDARQREIETASQVAAIRRLRLDNRIDLHLALGGDFTL